MATKENKPKALAAQSEHVMVTFGRGCAELKRNFDKLAKDGGYTKAGLALVMIREGVAQRMAPSPRKTR